MKNQILRYLKPLVLAASLIPQLAPAAVGLKQILRGTQFASFSDADWKVFLNSALTTVSSQPDGVDVSWNSEKSGIGGTHRVVRSYTQHEHACRDLSGDTVLKGHSEAFKLTYCQDPAGHWRLASSKKPG